MDAKEREEIVNMFTAEMQDEVRQQLLDGDDVGMEKIKETANTLGLDIRKFEDLKTAMNVASTGLSTYESAIAEYCRDNELKFSNPKDYRVAMNAIQKVHPEFFKDTKKEK